MELDDGADDREAEAEAALVALVRGVAAVEALPEVGHFVLVDVAAGVVDADPHDLLVGGVRPGEKGDRAALVDVGQGVFEVAFQHLLDLPRVGVDKEGVRQLAAQRGVGTGEQAGTEPVDELRQVEDLPVERDLPRLVFRKLQQAEHQPVHPGALVDDRVAIGVARGGVDVEFEPLGVALNDRDRRFELVRDVGDEAPPHRVELALGLDLAAQLGVGGLQIVKRAFELVRKVVDRRRQLADLVAAFDVQATAEIEPRHVAGDGAHLGDRARKLAGEKEHPQNGDDKAGGGDVADEFAGGGGAGFEQLLLQPQLGQHAVAERAAQQQKFRVGRGVDRRFEDAAVRQRPPGLRL